MAPPAVAPAGYTLPTFNGLPNINNSVYDDAYHVSNQQTGQDPYGNSRPFQVAPAQLRPYTTTNITKGKLEDSPSFPSGHTTYAFTDSILLGMMVPELYQSMLVRASEFGYGRLVVGAHYPIDVIGARSLATYGLAQYLSNMAYINNQGVTGTAVDMPALHCSGMWSDDRDLRDERREYREQSLRAVRGQSGALSIPPDLWFADSLVRGSAT